MEKPNLGDMLKLDGKYAVYVSEENRGKTIIVQYVESSRYVRYTRAQILQMRKSPVEA